MRLNYLLIGGLLYFASCETPQKTEFNLNIEKEYTLLKYGIDSLQKLYGNNYKEGSVPVLKNGQDYVPFQVMAEDDQVWYYLSKGEYLLEVEWVDAQNLPPVKDRVNLRFAKKPDLVEDLSALRLETTDTKVSSKHFQMEGPAWENDFVAFRNYYDARNGMDIFGKKTNEMILDKVGTGELGSYHELADWGMDILKVGNSLGSGAIALPIENTLYRIGPDSKGSISNVKKGPLVTSFNLDFADWEINGDSYQVSHKITIEAGKRYYESTVEVSKNGAPYSGELVTGLVNLDNDSLYTWQSGNTAILATFDNQAFDGEKLGMAITCSNAQLSKTALAPEEGEGITQTHLVYLKPNVQDQYKFRVYACWEFENNLFAELASFKFFLESEVH